VSSGAGSVARKTGPASRYIGDASMLTSALAIFCRSLGIGAARRRLSPSSRCLSEKMLSPTLAPPTTARPISHCCIATDALFSDVFHHRPQAVLTPERAGFHISVLRLAPAALGRANQESGSGPTVARNWFAASWPEAAASCRWNANGVQTFARHRGKGRQCLSSFMSFRMTS
jgi:hypothetical protein